MPDLVKNILHALSDKKPGLLDDARQILNALEYDSERTLDETHSAREFLHEYDPKNGEGINAKELQHCAQKIGIVFQVGDEEINRGLMAPAFKPNDEKSFIFVAADLDPKQNYPRWRLARITRAVNRCFAAPAVVIFRHPDADEQDSISLSFIYRRTSRIDSAKDVLGRVSILRGIRRENPHRGHLDILKDLALSERVEWMRGEKQSPGFDGLLAAWLNALDTEELNKRFYKKLLAWFERAVQQCKFPDGKIAGKSEEQVMRMITRLLFIWFVKEKGLASENLFTNQFAGDILKNHRPENSDYYRAVLQNLFFGVLNTPQTERGFRPHNQPPSEKKYNDPQHRVFTFYRYADLINRPPDFVRAVREIPFVNGGLFDCLDDFERGGSAKNRNRAAGRVDCFTDNRNDRKMLHVPSRLFFAQDDGLFTLFNQFKFTVDENTPLDQEVALDPELLGLVFENLLAATTPESRENIRKNPKSRENIRKKTGSFYTPRPIVEYMVDEALIAHLAGILGKKSEPKLRKLLEWGDIADDLFSVGEEKTVTDAIDKLRILDPAVGSGAFPMGMLHKLVHILSRVDEKNKKWKKKQLEKAAEISDPSIRGRTMDDIERVFSSENNYDDYGRKLFLIQNAIHGADLQPVAAQIARLRFFISLIIDQKPRDDQPNRGIEPLPNLETKFVAADSLIGLSRPEGALQSPVVEDLLSEINSIRRDYFGAKTRDRKRILKNEDTNLRKKLSAALKKGGDWGVEDANRFAEWDVYDQTAGADWFDAELMMGIRDGFHIVIGNPPYVRADVDEKHKAYRQKIMETGAYKTLCEKWDLFIPFMERGFQLLAPNGVESFIVSDAYCNAKYGKKSREWFLRNSAILRLDFYTLIKIFDAGVHNLSFVFRNAKGENNVPIRRLHEESFGNVQILSCDKQCESDQRIFAHNKDEKITLSVPVVQCSDVFYISKGMCIHSDEKRAKGAFSKKELLSNSQDTLHSKPFIEGKHMARWIPKAQIWLEWGTDRAPAMFSRVTFPELYSSGERLISAKVIADKKPLCVAYDDSGILNGDSVWSFLRWCQLEGVRNRSISTFARYPDEAAGNKPSREALEKTSSRFSVKYALGVLNSHFARWYLRGNRRSNLSLYPGDWKVLPIPDVSATKQAKIADLVDKILSAKRKNLEADVSEWESEINRRVYALYGLTEADIRLVEGEGEGETEPTDTAAQ